MGPKASIELGTPGEAGSAGAPRGESRARADRACETSRHLCARATREVHRSRELRAQLADGVRSWRAWRRLWRRLMRHARPLAERPGTRPLVRVCMYCARVYVALPLARGTDDVDRSWDLMPPWVREQFGNPALRVILSHGMCPPCARRHLPDF